MRYGLISNYRRSWSKKGQRTIIDNQYEYISRYLYSAIEPITGESFHLLGFENVNGLTTELFLRELQKEYPSSHLIVVWDKAPFHRTKKFKEIENLTTIFLPPYSPQLNPVERFFGEMRKVTANRIFGDIKEIESMLIAEVIKWRENLEAVKDLCGYEWINKQYKNIMHSNYL